MGNSKLPLRQASINLFGRLTRDAELTFSPEGKATCGFSVAIERWTGKERVSWYANCRVFGKPAEKFAETGRKGMSVYVTGEPYMEDWTTKDGDKRKDFKVFVNTVDILEWPDDERGDQRPPSARAKDRHGSGPVRRHIEEPIDDSDIPF